ncbi:unnamed protein product [Trichogramma brassicae]|uniref:Uncharacterized protein n=1 Tax=Trichogramma brassicae TaxID=86971 RepID=A0A6H5I3S1_9HYME|nr:unnamed protein product [Trichogramma brassicae]
MRPHRLPSATRSAERAAEQTSGAASGPTHKDALLGNAPSPPPAPAYINWRAATVRQIRLQPKRATHREHTRAVQACVHVPMLCWSDSTHSCSSNYSQQARCRRIKNTNYVTDFCSFYRTVITQMNINRIFQNYKVFEIFIVVHNVISTTTIDYICNYSIHGEFLDSINLQVAEVAPEVRTTLTRCIRQSKLGTCHRRQKREPHSQDGTRQRVLKKMSNSGGDASNPSTVIEK